MDCKEQNSNGCIILKNKEYEHLRLTLRFAKENKLYNKISHNVAAFAKLKNIPINELIANSIKTSAWLKRGYNITPLDGLFNWGATNEKYIFWRKVNDKLATYLRLHL